MTATRLWAAFDMLVGTLSFTLGVPVTLSVLEFGFTLEFFLTAGITLAGGMLALAGVFLRPTPEPRVREARFLLVPVVVIAWIYLGEGIYWTLTADEAPGSFVVIPAVITAAITVQMIWLIRSRALTRRNGVTE